MTREYRVARSGCLRHSKNVRAFQEMPPSRVVHTVKRLCGSINCLADFLPRVSQITEPLRKLHMNDESWVRKDEEVKAFHETMNLVPDALVHTYHNPK